MFSATMKRYPGVSTSTHILVDLTCGHEGFRFKQMKLTNISIFRPMGSLPESERGIVAPSALVQQGLADLDRNIDAILRLQRAQQADTTYCTESPSIQLAPGSFCPFNSQEGANDRICTLRSNTPMFRYGI